MSENTFGRTVYPLALVLWTGAFGWRACAISRDVSVMNLEAGRLEDESRALDSGARRLRLLVRDYSERARDARFLQDIPNILPEDKGYLRTQEAIKGEVRLLRARVSKRLRGQLHLVIDAKANTLYVKNGVKLLWQADVSVGRGGILMDAMSGRKWEFVTPRGEFRVIGKAFNPQWRKPDWAYVENGEPVPPPGDPSRMVSGELGAFVMNLGDGFLIHGTKREELLGHPASHGCVRVGAADLEKLYVSVPNGTRVFIFE
ncbi:MAG: L,D-transpeptidase [Elusimicrobiota bacterium]